MGMNYLYLATCQTTDKQLHGRDKPNGVATRVDCLALGGVDLTSAAGKMTMGVIAAVAQFKRDLLIERTQAGLERAKAPPFVLGSPPEKRLCGCARPEDLENDDYTGAGGRRWGPTPLFGGGGSLGYRVDARHGSSNTPQRFGSIRRPRQPSGGTSR
jgi:hypothetical protein